METTLRQAEGFTMATDVKVYFCDHQNPRPGCDEKHRSPDADTFRKTRPTALRG
jgi:hypothetical protein